MYCLDWRLRVLSAVVGSLPILAMIVWAAAEVRRESDFTFAVNCGQTLQPFTVDSTSAMMAMAGQPGAAQFLSDWNARTGPMASVREMIGDQMGHQDVCQDHGWNL